MVVGCRVAFDAEFSASATLSRARQLGATQFFGVGAMAVALLARPSSPDDKDHTIDRAVFVPVAPQAQREFEARFGCLVFCEGYGQTEVLPATMGVTRTRRDKPSAGKAVPWLDVQVVDDDDNVLPVGDVGEIVVRPLEPHSMFAGYWRKEADTVAAWRNLRHHTGDRYAVAAVALVILLGALAFSKRATEDMSADATVIEPPAAVAAASGD